MDDMIFGLTLMLVGMGGTMFTLALISVAVGLIKRLFPKEHRAKGR